VAFREEVLVSSDKRFSNFLQNTFLEIDGFEYPLSKLLNESKFTLQIDKEGKMILDSNDSFIQSLKGFGTESIRFSLFHRRAQRQIEVGSYLSRCDCASQCGGPAREIHCDRVGDRGSASKEPFYLDYSFYTSVFVF
jgi:hypothetical protein